MGSRKSGVEAVRQSGGGYTRQERGGGSLNREKAVEVESGCVGAYILGMSICRADRTC